MKFQIVEDELVCYEQQKVSMAEAASGEYPCLTFGPLEASFWAIYKIEEWEDIMDACLTSLSVFPFPFRTFKNGNNPQHAIDFEISEFGLAELMDICQYPWNDQPISFMLKTGIAPFQPFRIHGKMEYTHDSYNNE